MNSINVGDIGNYNGVLVYVKHIDGGIYYLSTPHDTVISAGFAWLAADWRPLTEEEKLTYNDYVQDAARQKAALLAP